jgi:ATP-dependent Lon protease
MKKMKEEFIKIKEKLGEEGASKKAAEELYELIKSNSISNNMQEKIKDKNDSI